MKHHEKEEKKEEEEEVVGVEKDWTARGGSTPPTDPPLEGWQGCPRFAAMVERGMRMPEVSSWAGRWRSGRGTRGRTRGRGIRAPIAGKRGKDTRRRESQGRADD